jgi:hypothetical protein
MDKLAGHDKDDQKNKDVKQQLPEAEKQQRQSDPNLTELKGFTEPDEKLEPEGTDQDV